MLGCPHLAPRPHRDVVFDSPCLFALLTPFTLSGTARCPPNQNYRPHLEEEVRPFLSFVQSIYEALPETAAKLFNSPPTGQEDRGVQTGHRTGHREGSEGRAGSAQALPTLALCYPEVV